MKKLLLLTVLCGSVCLVSHGQQLTLLEYFFDNDLGIGKNRVLNVPVDNNGLFSFSADVSQVAEGYHTLFFRIKDSQGQWSHTHSRLVEVTGGPVENKAMIVEYFMDKEPGVGNGYKIALALLLADGEFALKIPREHLIEGSHTLYFRVHDLRERVSHTAWQAIDIRFTNCTPPTQPTDLIGSSSACSGSVFTLSVQEVAAAKGYRWRLPTGWALISGQGTAVITVKVPEVNKTTEFTDFAIVAYNDCDSSSAKRFSIVVNPAPETPLITSSHIELLPDEKATLSASAISGVLFQWLMDGTEITGATHNTYETNIPGVYTVRVTGLSKCSSISVPVTITKSLVTKREPASISHSSEVYPNPTTGPLKVSINRNSMASVAIRMWDIQGRSLYSEHIVTAQDQFDTFLDITGYSPGLYFLIVEAGSNRWFHRVLKR